MCRFPGAGVARVCTDVEHSETGNTQILKNTLSISSEFRAARQEQGYPAAVSDRGVCTIELSRNYVFLYLDALL